MDRYWRPLIEPLGLKLRRAAARVAAAKLPRLRWLEASERLRTRVAELPEPATTRYARLEISNRVVGEPRLAADDPEPDVAEYGRQLPASVRERLRADVGDAADALRIHDDDRADRVAAHHDADAVTTGSDVFFRHGRYRPHDGDGLALLAHEATHVSQALRPNGAWRSPLADDVAAEESAAIAVERSVRRPFVAQRAVSGHAVTAARRLAGPMTAPAATAAPAPRPMTAAVDRPLDSSPTAPPFNMEDLRQSLARDLLRQIRSELERGG